MDHPRGGKRLLFDEPLVGYPSRRQRLSQPTVATQASLPSAPAALLLPPPSTAATFSPAPPAIAAAPPATAAAPPATTAAPPARTPAPPARSRALLPSTSASASSGCAQQPSPIIPTQLIEDHSRRQAATARFPPEISNSCVRDCLAHYQDHMSAVTAATERVCGSCGRFIEKGVFRLSVEDPLLLPFRIDATSPPRLDSCSLDGPDYLFCQSCFTAIKQLKPPKYSALNAVNVSFCQDYPVALQGLTLTEERLIARGHPIASIVKLRPHGASYQRLQGHIIVLPQEPGALLDILPSAEINLPDKIKVIWFGDRVPTAEDLEPCLEVRKAVVLRALQWLRLYNKLYRHIAINQELLDSWADSFIPRDLEESMVHSKEDHEEREGYTADLGAGNHENDLQEALDSDGQATGSISSGCVYSDVESARQHPTLQLVSAILNLERDRFERDSPPDSAAGNANPPYIEDVPVIRYVSTGRSVLMNDWQDPEFFTGSFPTLFPFGSGGHLPEPQDRPVPVSLQAWAKWALTHHSRRYVSNP
jgi:hypothetical protein